MVLLRLYRILSLQLGTNHFGHFYLFSLLRSNLTAQSDPCRVVVLASIAHNMGSVDLNDLHFRHGRIYTSWGAYGQSKTANMLFAKVSLCFCVKMGWRVAQSQLINRIRSLLHNSWARALRQCRSIPALF